MEKDFQIPFSNSCVQRKWKWYGTLIQVNGSGAPQSGPTSLRIPIRNNTFGHVLPRTEERISSSLSSWSFSGQYRNSPRHRPLLDYSVLGTGPAAIRQKRLDLISRVKIVIIIIMI